MNRDDYKYWAFISYSHQDKVWGDWLHKALETYRVPKRLVGRTSRDGVVPKRLYPIFRDREELPTSSDLGSNINEALRQSRYLIVICSPKSAVSKWVNEEVKAFKAMGREDRILCLIVDGEPNASDKPNSGLLECFPEAIRYIFDSKGEITKSRSEPIAADAREGKDGKDDAKLKILSGLLGVAFDELKQREKQRQFWLRVQLALVSVVFISTIVVVWYLQEREKGAAERAARSEHYAELGRQEIGKGEWVAAAIYLAEAYRLDSRSPQLRFMTRHTLLQIGSSKLQSYEGRAFVLSHDLSRAMILLADGNWQAQSLRDGKPLSELKTENEFWGMTFSPDSRRVAAWGRKDDARVWDVDTGNLVVSLHAHQQKVTCLTFSPDGSHLATGGHDGTVKLWNLSTGILVATLKGHSTWIYSVAYSANGKALVAVSGNTAFAWDLGTRKLISKKPTGLPAKDGKGWRSNVGSAWVNPDASRLWTEYGPEINVWNLSNGKLITQLSGDGGDVQWVRFSADWKRAVASGWDQTVAWNTDVPSFLSKVPGTKAAISADGSRILTGAAGGIAKLWDAASGASLGWLVEEQREYIELAAFSPDSLRIATVSGRRNQEGQNLTIWHAAKINLLLEKSETHTDTVLSVRFSPDGRRVVTASRDGRSRIWDANTGQLLMTLEGHDNYMNHAEFTPDGTHVLTGSMEGSVRFWDASTGRNIRSISVESGSLLSVASSPDGTQLATASHRPGQKGSTVALWDSATGKKLKTIIEPADAKKSHNDPGVQRVAGDSSARPDARHYLRRVSLIPDQNRIFSVSFSRDGKAILTVGEAEVSTWNVGTGKLIRTFKGGRGRSGSFSSDGRIFIAGLDGSVSVWNASNGELVDTLQTDRGDFLSIMLSPDGTRILTAGADGKPKIWDTVHRKLLATYVGHGNIVSSTAFDSTGEKFATVTDDRILRVWDASLESRPPEELAALLRCRLSERLQEGKIVPAAPDPAACPKPATAAR